MRREDEPGRSRRGFTLIELLIVMVIIGIIISLILVAAYDGIRRAEERATQSLITKLDGALTDRIEGLLANHPDPTGTLIFTPPSAMQPLWTATAAPPFSHMGFAMICDQGPGVTSIGANQALAPIHTRAFLQRAQVIAQYDYVKSELPDVFFFPTAAASLPTTQKAAVGVYPINFGMPSTFNPVGTNFPNANYWLPIGALSLSQVTGIFGASFSAAGGIAKNLGAAPQGYDGTDNDGDGNVDDLAEWYTNLSQPQINNIIANIANHQANTPDGLETQQRTARSEMLYALLVEGQGPFGSAFAPDDFTSKEVQDTDNDGLPEFVNAWGQPLQFYRWPLFYHSDLQKGLWTGTTGLGPYDSQFEAREKDPLDPNSQLTAPGWWAASWANNLGNQGPGGFAPPANAEYSGSAVAFQTFFHALTEPLLDPAYPFNVTGTVANFWDRSGSGAFVQRRAFYSRFLIASSGPDMNMGIARGGLTYANVSYTVTDGTGASSFQKSGLNATTLQLEGYAVQGDLNIPATFFTNNTRAFLLDAGNDDITNHNIQAPGGGTK